MRSFLFKLFLFLLCFIALERFCHQQTQGFRLYKIQTTKDGKEAWDIPIPSQNELKDYFSQKYRFLNSGGECYVFASEDGRYVLKFFKNHHMRAPFWTKIFPRVIRQKIEAKKTARYEKFYTSCKLAYDHFRNRTGLVFLHLNPTRSINKTIKIYDAIGAVHTIDLDKTPFALQEFASMAYPTISQLVNAQEIEAANLRLNSLLDLILERCTAKLADHDTRKRNFGFVGTKAIELDLGSFTVNDTLADENASRKILLLETMKLRRWVKKNHPVLSKELEENIKSRLNS